MSEVVRIILVLRQIFAKRNGMGSKFFVFYCYFPDPVEAEKAKILSKTAKGNQIPALADIINQGKWLYFSLGYFLPGWGIVF